MTLLNMVRIFVKSNPPYWLELQQDPKSVCFSTSKPSLGWEWEMEAGRSWGRRSFCLSFFLFILKQHGIVLTCMS